MKKNILAILIITFILSITACSSKKKNTDDFSMTTYEESTSGVTISYPGNFSEKEETVDGITFYTKGKKAKLEIYVTPNSNLDVETFLSQADYDSSTIKNKTEDSFDQDLRESESAYVVTALTSEYIVIAGITYMDSEKDIYYSLCNELSIKVPDDKKVGTSKDSTNDSSDGSTDTADDSNDTADGSNDTADSSNDATDGSTDTSDGANSDESGKDLPDVFSSDLSVTKELLDTVLVYDSFTWGGASQKEKISMATNIISMFALVDGPIDKDAKALVTELDQLMSNGDQLNVFEEACSIYDFEFSNYLNLANTLSTEGENSENTSNDTNASVEKPSSKLLTRVLYYDIFDWQSADDAAKTVIASEMVQLLTYYELLWKDMNLEMNPQDFVDIINSDIENIGQDSLFNVICSKLGFDIAPYRELANQ